MHLNIASLGLHIDELRSLLSILEFDFDVLTISETKINEFSQNLINFEIEGYNNFYTPTKTNCGGTMIYVKKLYSSKLLPEFSQSEEGIFESTFIEIKKGAKSLTVGTIYRHPTHDNLFVEGFLHSTLDKLESKKRKVVISGDFNFDLLKYETHKNTNEFYDLISSYSYRPLILQPSRITYKSNTLIDNIFLNDLCCFSEGGNITSSISDHFIQFSLIDIFTKNNKCNKTEYKLRRNFRNFNHNEFFEELNSINWDNVRNDNEDIDKNVSLFLEKIDSLLNVMAPLKKQTKREQRLEKRPWITKGLLKSMKIRDSLYKDLTKKNNNPIEKRNISICYKKYRNLIITLLRRSKENYYKSYFEKNKND